MYKQGDERIYLYDIETSNLVWEIKDFANILLFSPDGQTVVSANNRLQIRQASTGQLIEAPSSMEGNALILMAFLPDDSALLIGRTWHHGKDTFKSEIGVWDDINKQVNVKIETENNLDSIAISSDGKLLATAFANLPDTPDGYMIFLWDLATYQKICSLPGSNMTFSPVEPLLASGDYANGITLVDTTTCQPRLEIPQSQLVSSFTFSPNGKILALASDETSTIQFREVGTGDLIYEQDGQWDTIEQLSFSPDGQFLMAHERYYGEKDVVQIWKIQLP